MNSHVSIHAAQAVPPHQALDRAPRNRMDPDLRSHRIAAKQATCAIAAGCGTESRWRTTLFSRDAVGTGRARWRCGSATAAEVGPVASWSRNRAPIVRPPTRCAQLSGADAVSIHRERVSPIDRISPFFSIAIAGNCPDKRQGYECRACREILMRSVGHVAIIPLRYHPSPMSLFAAKAAALARCWPRKLRIVRGGAHWQPCGFLGAKHGQYVWDQA
jgi:hypothetical protein